MQLPDYLKKPNVSDWYGDIYYTTWNDEPLVEGDTYYLINTVGGIQVFTKYDATMWLDLPADGKDYVLEDILDEVYKSGWSMEIASTNDHFEDKKSIN